MNNNDETADGELHVHERGPGRPLIDWIIIALVVVQTITLGLGLPNIITGSSGAHNLKIAALTLGAGLVSFGVLHLAVRTGAPYAAKRFRLAAIASVLGISLVGVGFGSATFSGNVLPDVAALEVQTHGTNLGLEIADLNQVANEAGRSGATLGVIALDLRSWADCEQAKSCLSHAKSTGRGSITIVLEGLAERAQAIQQEFDNGTALRDEALEEINGHYTDYQEIVGRSDLSIWERRNKLKLTDNLLHQATAKLANAVPLHLIAQYSKELKAGITLPGRADVAGRINKILSDHGKNLDAILKSARGADITRPVFPERPGVGDALTHALTFLPLFALILAIDAILPISVWVMAYLEQAWIVERKLNERKVRSQVQTRGRGRSRKPGNVHNLKNGKTTPLHEEAH